MKKGFIVLSLLLVAVFLVGCSTKGTQKIALPDESSTATGTDPTTSLDSDINSLDSGTNATDSVDSGLNDINKDLDTL